MGREPAVKKDTHPEANFRESTAADRQMERKLRGESARIAPYLVLLE